MSSIYSGYKEWNIEHEKITWISYMWSRFLYDACPNFIKYGKAAVLKNFNDYSVLSDWFYQEIDLQTTIQ